MNRFYLSYLILPLIVVFSVVVYLGYLGIFPGVSHIFRTDIPRDLGISCNLSDYDSFVGLAGTEITVVKEKVQAENSLKFTGIARLDQKFSDSQVSARINYSLWKYMPLTNFRIRFITGNVLEFSGNLRIDRLAGFISAAGNKDVTRTSLYSLLRVLGWIPNNPPVYVRATVSVTDNIVAVKTEKAVIGKIDLPLDQLNADIILKKVTESVMDKIPGFKAGLVTFSDGMMSFSGTVPAREFIYLDK